MCLWVGTRYFYDIYRRVTHGVISYKNASVSACVTAPVSPF